MSLQEGRAVQSGAGRGDGSARCTESDKSWATHKSRRSSVLARLPSADLSSHAPPFAESDRASGKRSGPQRRMILAALEPICGDVSSALVERRDDACSPSSNPHALKGRTTSREQ